jgi:hypothetical protein
MRRFGVRQREKTTKAATDPYGMTTKEQATARASASARTAKFSQVATVALAPLNFMGASNPYRVFFS